MHPDHVNQYFQIIVGEYAADLTRGVIITVSDGLIRKRNLPL